MRIALVILTVLVLTFGFLAFAQGDEALPAVTPKALAELTARVEALQAEVEYLRSREDALRAYVLANDQRAKGLMDVVARARRAGFEANRIPVDSRKILMSGLEAAAKSLQKGLPAVTPAEAKLLKQITRLRRAAKLD